MRLVSRNFLVNAKYDPQYQKRIVFRVYFIAFPGWNIHSGIDIDTPSAN